MPTCMTCSQELTADTLYCPKCGTPNPEATTETMRTATRQSVRAAAQADLVRKLQTALGANFHVDHELGEGGFAHVFAATDRKLSRQIAVKVLRPEFTGSGVSVQRFIREAEAAAKLHHPNILSIFFVGEGEGLVYFGMPLVVGETLDARLRREGQIAEDEVIRIGVDIADALAEAHAQGLVHRDIKPQNVMLQGEQRRVLVADFGIAKAAAGTGERLTGTGTVIGSPHYMSPEQAAGGLEVDGRSDIYSLGIVLWEMLAGEVPFDGPTTQGILIQHLTKAMPTLRTRRPNVSTQLDRIVARCTEKKPADRFQTAGELAAALKARATAAAVAAAEQRRFPAARAAGLAAAALVLVGGGVLVVKSLKPAAGARGAATEQHAAPAPPAPSRPAPHARAAPAARPPKTVQLAPSIVTLTVGGTHKLTPLAYDTDGNVILSGVRYRWSSGNAEVARVSSSGTVTAVAEGKALIRAEALNSGSPPRSGTAEITVKRRR
jgi:serine/threonine-protein kinase